MTRERAARMVFTVYKRVVSPVLHGFGSSVGGCRYLPTCSDYAFAAVVKYGWLRGSWMAARRLARCHPWSRGGFDPLP